MKKIVFLTFILLCIISLFSCSNSEKPKPSNGRGDDSEKVTATPIPVSVYIDGSLSQTIYTDATREYTVTPPEKPEDITTNPNAEKYFYGWFVDSNFQTPLFDTTKFQNGGAIYGKWITVYSNSFQYTVDYGKATIVGFTDHAPTVLVIPAYVNSFPVARIGVDAFKDQTTIRTVILCNGIEEVGGFNGCNSIEKIEIPTSVIKIGDYGFANCGFYEFDIPSQIVEIGDFAFTKCNKLTNVDIPDTTKVIGYGAFNGCSSLTSITIPDKVTSIGGAAFSGCDKLNGVYFSDLTKWCSILFGGIGANPLERAHKLYINGTLVTDLEIPNNVTSIGDYAFSGCSSLVSIVLPSSITNIGTNSFSSCSGVTNVTLKNGLKRIGDLAFNNCSKLTNITIPNSVTDIGSGAFKDCSTLMSISIPNSVTRIGTATFGGCSNLSSMTLPFVDGYFAYYFFRDASLQHNSEAIPSSLKTVVITGGTNICGFAFAGCASLTSITIPSSVKRIGKGAFAACNSLTSITIPFIGESATSTDNTNLGYIFGNLSYSDNSRCIPGHLRKVVITGGENIGEGAFRDCTGLTDIILPDSIINIGASAFDDCSSLKSITIPDGVTSIGYGAFWGCSSLTSITIPDSVTSIGGSAFSGCSSLTSITIGNGVTSIGNYAFRDCSSLTSITIPDSVTSIGSYAFAGCSGLTSITIPDSVTSIGSYAFAGCSGLTSITIPDSVTSIGERAFYGWQSSQTIYCQATPQPNTGDFYWNDSCYAKIVWGV